MVAILGPIMAAPFARPSSETDLPPKSLRALTSLGRVSVVRIALDTRWKLAASLESDESTVARPDSSRSIGSWWPMMPVEATRTSSGRQPSTRAATSAVRLAFASPVSPVAALALPALMTIARMLDDGTRARSHFTGAAHTRFVVNVPAAEQGPSATIAARSSPPEGLIPAFVADARNPRGMFRGGCSAMMLRSLSGFEGPSLGRVAAVDEERGTRHEA